MLKIFLSGDHNSFWQDVVIEKGPDWPGVIYLNPRELRLPQYEITDKRLEKLRECNVLFAYRGKNDDYAYDGVVANDISYVKSLGNSRVHVIFVDAKQDNRLSCLQGLIDFKTDSFESAINHLYSLALAEIEKREGMEKTSGTRLEDKW